MSFTPEPNPLSRKNGGPIAAVLFLLIFLGLAATFIAWSSTPPTPAAVEADAWKPRAPETTPDGREVCWCVNPSSPGCATYPGGPCENCPRKDYSLGPCPGDLDQ